MPRPKGDIDERILHAARRRFLIEGVDGASLRAVARDAETSIGMVYYYFPTKDDLFLAVVEEVYERLLADLVVALSPEKPVRERIQRLYERVGKLDEDELTMLRLVVREALVSSSRLESLIARFQRGHLPHVFRTILDGVADGTLDASRHPLLLCGALLGVGGVPQVLRRLLGDSLPGLSASDDLSQQLVDMLLNGIGRRSAPSSPARDGADTSPSRAPRARG